MTEFKNRLVDAQRILEALLNSKKYDFQGLKPSDLEDKLRVVYAIFDKKDGSCLYVGRTINLRRRLYTNHLMGPEANARLKKYLINDKDLKDINTPNEAKKYLTDRCYFQYLPVRDKVQRGQTEGLLSYLLNVRYIHEEH